MLRFLRRPVRPVRPARTRISVVMLVHNELPFLQINLPILSRLVDEIVVVDMMSRDGSRAYIDGLAAFRVRAVDYPRGDLFRYGFAHARNVGAAHATGDWIFMIDADEVIVGQDVRAALAAADRSAPCFDVERRNYRKTAALDLDAFERVLETADFATERHRRIYRNDGGLRYEGLVHEELWQAGQGPAPVCAPCPLILHHLAAYRPGGEPAQKHHLYAYLLMKAYLDPGFRAGINAWYFDHYVPENLSDIQAMADAFAAGNDLAPIRAPCGSAV